MENIATITSKGQMTIPKDIRKALDLRPKDRMLFVLHEDRIEMIPLRMRPFSELFGVLPVDEPAPDLDTLRQMRHQELAERSEVIEA